nr:hypothetical protein [Acidobacteriota bacterium]
MAFFGKPDNPTPPPQPPSPPSTPASVPRERTPAPPSVVPAPGASTSSTVIGSRMRVVGDVTGDEDVVVNGRVEGKIRIDR